MTKTDLSTSDSSVNMEATAEIDRTMSMTREQLKAIGRTQMERTQTSFITDRLSVFTEHRDVNQVIESSYTHRSKNAIIIDGDEFENLEKLDDKYDRGNAFAEGGQGVLFEGVDKNLRRLVAIKSIKPEFTSDPRLRKLFISEAKVTAQLDHPSIIPIYSLNSEADNGLSLTMKLVDGQTLKSYLEEIRSHYRLDGIGSFDEKESLRTRLEIFLNVCNGMEYAHSRNVMHCDLKPENIIIGEFRETFIMDWGIAHLIRGPGYDPDHWEKPKRISGTPRFLPPETIMGEYCDQRADIFTLGLILFEIVTLQEAYIGSSSEDVIAMIREGRMAPIEHRFKYRIDPDLKAIIRKAANPDRKKRYQSVKVFSDDIRRYLDNAETIARPDNFIRGGFRFAVSHPKSTVTIFFMLLLAAFISTFCSLYNELQRIKTERSRETVENLVYARSSDTASLLERNILSQAQKLPAISMETLFVVHANPNITDSVMPVPISIYHPNNLTFPETYKSSRFYPEGADFYHVGYLHPSGNVSADQQIRLRRLSLIQDRLLSQFQADVPTDRILKNTEENRIRYMLHDGITMSHVYFGFSDGLFLVYPAGHLRVRDYDPRMRQWYIQAMTAHGNAVWSKPYFRKGSSDIMLTCSIAMIDNTGRLHGVAALDLNIQVVLDQLNKNGNGGGYVVSKTLIDGDGDILLSTDPDFKKDLRDRKTKDFRLAYPKEDILEKAAKIKFGVISVKENETRYLYCINSLFSSNWIYIEKLNADKLLH